MIMLNRFRIRILNSFNDNVSKTLRSYGRGRNNQHKIFENKFQQIHNSENYELKLPFKALRTITNLFVHILPCFRKIIAV